MKSGGHLADLSRLQRSLPLLLLCRLARADDGVRLRDAPLNELPIVRPERGPSLIRRVQTGALYSGVEALGDLRTGDSINRGPVERRAVRAEMVGRFVLPFLGDAQGLRVEIGVDFQGDSDGGVLPFGLMIETGDVTARLPFVGAHRLLGQ